MTATTDGQLHVALGFDENFWAPAYATMRGVCLHTHRRTDLRFHLCHPALSAEALAGLHRIAEEFGATLIHYDLDADAAYRHYAETLPHTRYITAVAYARLLFGQIIDPGVSRLVYLDCDLLVRAPIEELLAADLGGRPVGAVKDPHSLVDSNGRDGARKRDLFDPADPYFNSGVLVIDLDAWRRIDVAARLRALEADGTLKQLTADQQILNYLFKANWARLDGTWNTIGISPALEAFDPKIVHYTGLQKPWNLMTYLPFGRVYRHVMTNAVFYRFMRQRWARWWKSRIGLR